MKLKLFLVLFAALLVFAASSHAEPDPNFYVFLAFGQSNMEGFPGIQDQDKTGVDERFQMLSAVDMPDMERTKGNWYTATPPLCRPGCGICPADYFGRTMVEKLPEDIKVGVINVSVAGCKIEMFQKEGHKAYLESAAGWLKNIAATYDNNPYQYLVDMAKKAQEDGVIKGILLHQGESNSGDARWLGMVKEIYEDLLTDLELKAEDVPLLVGELVPEDQQGACAGMNKIIAKLPETVPTAHVISATGCEGRPDHLHFAPAGYREFGKRYAEKMLELLEK